MTYRLLIGATSSKHIDNFLKLNNSPVIETTLLLKKGRTINETVHKIRYFKNSLSLTNISLWKTLLSNKYDEIIVLTPKDVPSDNLKKALKRYSIISNSFHDIYFSYSTKESLLFIKKNFVFIPFAVNLFLLLVATLLLLKYPTIIIYLLFFEFLLKANKAKTVLEESQNNDGILYRNLKKTTTFSSYPVSICKGLGWINRPYIKGDQEIKLKGLRDKSYRWSFSHTSIGTRVTDIKNIQGSKGTIYCVGCSITYGFGLNDEETYPWILQELLSDYSIKNYGVIGYSLYQTFLQLQRILSKSHPKVIVLGFHSGLAPRNTNPFKRIFSWIKDIGGSPSCFYENHHLIEHKNIESYKRLPFSQFSQLINLAEFYFNKYRFFKRSNPKIIKKTNEFLLLRIRSLCKDKNIKLLVSCLDQSEEYFEFFYSHNFNWAVTPINRSNINDIIFPYDQHPNKNSNKIYANIIHQSIIELLNDLEVKPDISVVKNSGDKGALLDQDYLYPLY